MAEWQTIYFVGMAGAAVYLLLRISNRLEALYYLVSAEAKRRP